MSDIYRNRKNHQYYRIASIDNALKIKSSRTYFSFLFGISRGKRIIAHDLMHHDEKPLTHASKLLICLLSNHFAKSSRNLQHHFFNLHGMELF